VKITQVWLQKKVDELLERFNLPSMQVALTQQGEVIYAGRGVREVEKPEFADKDTVYTIASITKTFNAAAAALLVEEGLLSWDEPIINYLPDFQMYDDISTHSVTLRDLLCHRTGVPRHDASWANNRDQLQLSDVVHNIRYLEPNQPLRYISQYNNYMFALTSFIIEHVTGQDWDLFITERLLKPLGMNNTFFRKADIVGHPNRAIGHKPVADQQVPLPYSNIYFMGGTGCISSSVSDLIKWAQFQLNEGRVGDQQLISADMVQEFQHPRSTNENLPGYHFPEFSAKSYGICWGIEYYRGRKIVSHGGSLDGNLSNLALIPEVDVGIIILTNSGNHVVHHMLRNMIYDAVLDYSEGDWANRYEQEFMQLAEAARNTVSLTKEQIGQHDLPRDLAEYSGTYVHPAYGEFILNIDGDQLFTHYGTRSLELHHLIADNFVAIIEADQQVIPIQYQCGFDGVIHGANIGLEPKFKNGIYFTKKME